MKRIVLILIAIAILANLNGCFYMYGQARRIGEVRVQEQELALTKLENQPVLAHRVNGYKGIVANLNQYLVINTIITGPEKRSYALAPGQWVEDYLVSGEYTAISYHGNREVGRWTFPVGVQIQNYMGQKVHWYTYYNNY
ncbi:MAG: hypothetical protein PHQ42_00955 [Patescibacteria group bacterium]|nr:hypothetical protein [Patescibacteria group bacterium]